MMVEFLHHRFARHLSREQNLCDFWRAEWCPSSSQVDITPRHVVQSIVPCSYWRSMQSYIFLFGPALACVRIKRKFVLPVCLQHCSLFWPSLYLLLALDVKSLSLSFRCWCHTQIRVQSELRGREGGLSASVSAHMKLFEPLNLCHPYLERLPMRSTIAVTAYLLVRGMCCSRDFVSKPTSTQGKDDDWL